MSTGTQDAPEVTHLETVINDDISRESVRDAALLPPADSASRP